MFSPEPNSSRVVRQFGTTLDVPHEDRPSVLGPGPTHWNSFLRKRRDRSQKGRHVTLTLPDLGSRVQRDG